VVLRPLQIEFFRNLLGYVSAVRERLRLTPPDVFACVFSMSGYGVGALEEIRRERNREIILFDGKEIRGLAAGDLSFTELLVRKREAFRTHADTYFTPWVAEDRGTKHLRSSEDVIQFRGQLKKWMVSGTGDNDILFANEGLDFAGRYDSSAVSLDLRLIWKLLTTWREPYNWSRSTPACKTKERSQFISAVRDGLGLALRFHLCCPQPG